MSRILPEDDLLKDLNEICDFVIGNEQPQDASFNDRSTLPEVLAYITIYPNNQTATKEALDKMKKLSGMISDLEKKIKLRNFKLDLKKPKY